MTHEIVKEVEQATKESLKGRAITAVTKIREEIKLRNTWIKNRTEQNRLLEELQVDVLAAYDTADTFAMGKCASRLNEILQMKTGEEK